MWNKNFNSKWPITNGKSSHQWKPFWLKKREKIQRNVKRLKSVLNLQSAVLLILNKIYSTPNLEIHICQKEASESEFAEPFGYTSTPPAPRLLNDSEGAEVASNNAGLTQKIASETQDCGPRQPRLHKFPVRDPKSKKTKSFQASWYNQFDWLE